MIEESIRIRRAVLSAIEEHARAVAPAECCGLLIAGEGCIDEVVAVENQAADPARQYEVSPRDYLQALKRCRGTERIVIGAYHSHPRSMPEPSATDRAAAFSDFLYLIAGPVSGPTGMVVRAYRLKDGNFQPVSLVLEPKEPQT